MNKSIFLVLLLLGITMLSYNVSATAPIIVTGFTSQVGSLSLTDIPTDGSSYYLTTDNNAATEYHLQYKVGTSASNLVDGTYELYLTSISGTTRDNLKAYYGARFVDPSLVQFLTYLKNAADGSSPFAYVNITGSSAMLLDGARHQTFAGSQEVDMALPGDYPEGSYTVSGDVNVIGGGTSSVTYTVVVDRTLPALTVTGFTSDGTPMSGSVDGGYTLNTNNIASTNHLVQFNSGSVALENLKTEIVGLYLSPATGQTDALRTYYLTKPEPYQDYLNGAAAGTNPFAYIKTSGTTIRILDGAQKFLANTETDMVIPDNYPLGTYTVSGKIHDMAGNEATVTYKLIAAGDRTAPTLTITGFTDSGNVMPMQSGGYVLNKFNNLSANHVLQFNSASVSDEALASGPFGLYLVTSGVDVTGLTAYYNARAGLPDNYKNYLISALDGSSKPFAYVTADSSKNLILHDAAQYDLAGNHVVGMVIPDDYPAGIYPVTGQVSDNAGNLKTVSFTLVVQEYPFISILNNVHNALITQGIKNNIDTCGTHPTTCSGLYFKKVLSNGTALGKLSFSGSLDLTSTETTTFLQNLGTKLDQGNGRIAFDARTSAVFSATGAAIEIYNMPSVDQSKLIVRDDNGNVLNPSGIVSSFTYNAGPNSDGDRNIVSFNTAHFTQFDIDTIAPVIASKANILNQEATSSAGKVVTYSSPSTSDNIDGSGTAACLPASGSTFSLGNNTVTCTKTDAAGNSATPVTFIVQVVDTTPPALTVNSPTNKAYNMTDISLRVTTSDIASSVTCLYSLDNAANVTWSCSDTSLLNFSESSHTITVYAKDSSNNIRASAPISFTIKLSGTAPVVVNTSNVTVNSTNTDIIIPVGQPIETVNITQDVPDDKQVTLDLSLVATTNATAKSVSLANDLTLSRDTSTIDYAVTLPTGTKISGPTSWNGIINVPTVKATTSVTPTQDSGMTNTVSTVIEVGYGDTKLTFDNAARLVISGQAGKLVGYSRGGIFTKITTTCADDTQTTNNLLPAESECKIDVGPDLVIWTKHFTTFATYTQSTTPASTSVQPVYSGTSSPSTCGVWSTCIDGKKTRECVTGTTKYTVTNDCAATTTQTPTNPSPALDTTTPTPHVADKLVPTTQTTPNTVTAPEDKSASSITGQVVNNQGGSGIGVGTIVAIILGIVIIAGLVYVYFIRKPK